MVRGEEKSEKERERERDEVMSVEVWQFIIYICPYFDTSVVERERVCVCVCVCVCEREREKLVSSVSE